MRWSGASAGTDYLKSFGRGSGTTATGGASKAGALAQAR